MTRTPPLLDEPAMLEFARTMYLTICADIREGNIANGDGVEVNPVAIGSFADLHDYVDANEYAMSPVGPYGDPRFERPANDDTDWLPWEDAERLACNWATEIVDVWLRQRAGQQVETYSVPEAEAGLQYFAPGAGHTDLPVPEAPDFAVIGAEYDRRFKLWERANSDAERKDDADGSLFEEADRLWNALIDYVDASGLTYTVLDPRTASAA